MLNFWQSLNSAKSNVHGSYAAVGMFSAPKEKGEPFPARAFRDRAWLATLDCLDGALRWRYGVYEFSDDPECLFRIALTKTSQPLMLGDGTFVPDGGVIGCLHFWNEHLPRFSASGPDLRWAQAMRSRMRRSLQELCVYVERDRAWQDVRALRADAPLPLRPFAREQMQRLAHRHGFESETVDAPSCGLLRAVGENMLLWGLARAYNPGAVTRPHPRHGRQSLWLSRKALRIRYGPAACAAGRIPDARG